ncbi:hypothetical protein Ari01nite_15850 [Paractinoplanes rishiriensis]|uniref:Uncharacterized protein n=1 Tax=Paractinoplanes rishiriensis TaxID=1050105 RepID=A0A919JUZ8_9ACTN|nr:hypothetical protein Ari01nite_15850 [Actinoplanes rishiriensis]
MSGAPLMFGAVPGNRFVQQIPTVRPGRVDELHDRAIREHSMTDPEGKRFPFEAVVRAYRHTEHLTDTF